MALRFIIVTMRAPHLTFHSMLENGRGAKLALTHSNINVGKSNLLLSFFQLSGGLLVATLFLILVLIASGHLVIEAIPDSWDRKLQASLSKLEILPVTPENSEVQAYLQRILDQLKTKSPLAEVPLRLVYSKDIEVNAYAVPGNWILVTQGLFLTSDSENEVAMVLAHELGHFYHRDHMKAYAQGMIYLLFSMAVFQNDDFLEYARGILSGVTNTYSRSHEADADSFALNLMNQGYDGNSSGILDFFKKRSEVEGKLGKKLAFFSTHPSSEERTRRLKKMIKELGMTPKGITELGVRGQKTESRSQEIRND